MELKALEGLLSVVEHTVLFKGIPVLALRADATDPCTAASATILVLEVGHGEAVSVEGPPEDELVSDTGRLSDGDPGSRSELRDSVIARETCEASWVTSVRVWWARPELWCQWLK